MTLVLTALLAACLIWWISTGAILIAVRLAERGGPGAGVKTTIAAVPLLGLGGWLYWWSLTDTGTQGAYAGFLGALALWGWVELSFLSGALTGPVQTPCAPSLPFRQRFWAAWGTIAHHELALTVLLMIVIELGWGAANTVGLWTFIILYFARISAKLNLFLGVAYVNTEFLPRHLAHLPSYFGAARLNWLFPVSVTGLTFAFACWIERLIAVETAGAQVGFSLLAALTALALAEHWFLVLPLRDAKLWRWMLPKSAPRTSRQTTGVEP